MSVYAEVWRRPGHATFGRVIDGLPSTSFGLHASMTRVGDGNMTLPDTFDRFSDILNIDPATPANSTSSLIRYFSDEDPTTPFFEWLPNLIVPSGSKDDRTAEVTGKGIKQLLSYARTEAFDWDGSDDFSPTFPDWIYGGRNILRNPGFELSGTVAYVYSVWNDATGGTFTLDWDGQTTAAIAFNASSTDINNALENLANVTDVLVDGSGTEADPWRIEFVDPAVALTTGLTCDGSSLTGATEGCVVETVQVGSNEIPDVWEKSQRADRRSVVALHGCLQIFRRSSGAEPVRTGTHSLVMAPCATNGQYAGGQQLLSVTPGGTYQASIWINANTAGQAFRLVLRDRYERILTTAAGTEAFVEVTPAANTWTELSIENVLMELAENGEPVSEVVFRIAFINSTPAGIVYVDDAALSEGLAATTVGEILGDLYEDATVNHAGRVMWEDEANPGTSYLTLDFSDTVDSNGTTWAHPEIQMRVWMRMSFLQVVENIERSWGYEFRVVPNDVEAGTYLLQGYNPGTMKTDYTAAQSPAIQGGSSDVRRSIRAYLPASDFLVEGLERITSRDRDADLATAFGRIEASRLDRQLPSASAVQEAAYEDKVDAIPNASSYSYDLVNPQDTPLVDYTIGDLLVIHDPPEVEDDARLTDVVASFTKSSEEWEVDFQPATVEGS